MLIGFSPIWSGGSIAAMSARSRLRRITRWCQGDEFWRSNVQSMPKLREKFDQLRLKAQTPHRQQRRGVGIQSSMEGLAFFQPQEVQ